MNVRSLGGSLLSKHTHLNKQGEWTLCVLDTDGQRQNKDAYYSL